MLHPNCLQDEIFDWSKRIWCRMCTCHGMTEAAGFVRVSTREKLAAPGD